MTSAFPKDFTWGTATSSYQIEGAFDTLCWLSARIGFFKHSNKEKGDKEQKHCAFQYNFPTCFFTFIFFNIYIHTFFFQSAYIAIM